MATTNPIDEYLATLDEPKRATLDILAGHHHGHRPRGGAVHLLRDARVQAAREDHSQGSRPSRTTSATCPTAGR